MLSNQLEDIEEENEKDHKGLSGAQFTYLTEILKLDLEVIMEWPGISCGTLKRYLLKAITEDCNGFNQSLDKLYQKAELKDKDINL